MTGLFAKITSIIQQYLHTGIRNNTDIEIVRKITVLNLFAFVGFSITFSLGIRSIFDGDWPLTLSLFLAFSLFLSSHLYMRFSTLDNAYQLGSIMLQTVLITLCLYLIYSGGTNKTGPLWMYLVPPVILFFSGMRNGLITIMGFISLYCVIVFYPGNQIGAAEYSYEFKTRVLYSFLTLTFLAGFYEYSRQHSYQKLNVLTQKLERQARYDTLTQLLNRRGMLDRIDYEIQRTIRSKKSLSVLLADVDYFKKINDEHGHEAGDQVLEALGCLFLGNVRKQDSVARWGGEEFLFLLPDTNLEQAEQLAEKIRTTVANNHIAINDSSLRTSISFGVAEVENFNNVPAAINAADKRLYRAKEKGRDCVVSSD